MEPTNAQVLFTNANAGSANTHFELRGDVNGNNGGGAFANLGMAWGGVGNATVKLGSLYQGSLEGRLFNNVGGTTVTYEIGGANETNGYFTTYNGSVVDGAGTVAITKVGTGSETFSYANTYTGGTTVSGGTLGLRGQQRRPRRRRRQRRRA